MDFLQQHFLQDLTDFEPMREALQPIIDKVWSPCEEHDIRGRTVTLKVKFSDFTQITRSRSIVRPLDSREMLDAVSPDVLRAEMPPRRSVRLLGVSLSGLVGDEEPAGAQMTLVAPPP